MYLYGILLLVAVACGAGAANAVIWRSMPAPSLLHQRMAVYLDNELSPLVSDPAALDAKIDAMAEVFQVDVVVYDGAGKELASYGKPVAALDEIPDESFLHRRGPVHEFAVPLAGNSAYVIGTYRWRSGGWQWLLIPVVVLLVLAIVTYPMARSIARPVERITHAARSLGEGDLSARTGVDGKRRDELGELARAFDEMAARLERMVANEKELLANVSHELRTPLARIRVALELVEDVNDPAVTETHLAGIGGDLAELEQLIEQVLLTARLELSENNDGSLPLQRTAVAITSVAERAAERFRRLHVAHTLEVDVEEDLPNVDADPKLVRRVLDNLLDNASKYTEPDSGAIELAAALDVDAGAIAITVRDRGIGVADDDLAMLFEPFFRTDRSRERGSGGVGLGLALCRRIVTAHDGEIAASSRAGGGLEVRFTIPLA